MKAKCVAPYAGGDERMNGKGFFVRAAGLIVTAIALYLLLRHLFQKRRPQPAIHYARPKHLAERVR